MRFENSSYPLFGNSDLIAALFDKIGYNGRYCVGSGNSIPEYVKFENYIAILEAAMEFRR